MTHSSFARPALFIAAAAAIGACSSGGASTASTTPAPSPTPTTSASASAASARPAAGALPAGVTTAMVAEGDSIYHARGCRNCHGPDGKGRQNGPDLTTATHSHVNGTYEDYVRIITTGVPADAIKDKSHTLQMPPRGGGRPAPLTDDQIRAVAAYVYTLSPH